MKAAIISTALAAALLTGCGSSPESTVRNFYKAVDAGKVDQALESIDESSKSLWGSKLSAMVAQKVRKYDACDGIKSIEIKETAAKGDTWTGTSFVYFNNDKCKPEPDRWRLMKTGGKWLATVQ
ncbi:DUF4878 domain-containing protein [Azonexus sp.]|uniref:DUF4878 domain-containing protein n=1 Tax=Azonexus sp. TaxID=1872668 RepID=UPI0039E218FA